MTARRKTLFFLLLILLLAYVLRIYKFNQTLKLDADVGMAYLIAERIIREKFLLLVGPTTSFGETVNIVPPTYYYLITFLYWLFRSDLVVTFIFMLMEVISVYLIFLLGKILDNTRTGLISALFHHFIILSAVSVIEKKFGSIVTSIRLFLCCQPDVYILIPSFSLLSGAFYLLLN